MTYALTRASPQSDFHSTTLITAVVAAVATFVTIVMGLPTWAAFLGWVGYSISGQTTREGAANLVSFLLGLAFGLGTGVVIEFLTPALGSAAAPLAVFGVVIVVMSLRSLSPINNPLAYFLGLISFFASAQMSSLSLLAMLGPAGVLGAVSAWTVSYLQSRLQQAA
ncbi:hypothetical protein HNQ36_002074 [Afipia massiliensis]|uniref:DUF1097 domain-containing protein n=1 Tax=Afipia massiliensis TaxID=211460 RepID=A0A840MZC7_9BRAD|nr:DUF1097 domain-containing protein [Afipia massiliensis]MBB5052100.1 hypothetical protein [Afipia massiliensis]